jgi:hypothetical protein
MAALLVIGFFCNLALRPVDERYHMSETELASDRAVRAPGAA